MLPNAADFVSFLAANAKSIKVIRSVDSLQIASKPIFIYQWKVYNLQLKLVKQSKVIVSDKEIAIHGKMLRKVQI